MTLHIGSRATEDEGEGERSRTIIPSWRPPAGRRANPNTGSHGIALEASAARRRASVGVAILAVVWPLTTLLDVLYDHVGARGSVTPVLGARVVTTLYIWGLGLRLRTAPNMSGAELAWHRVGLITVLMASLALMSVFLGGFGSLYGVGAVALAGAIAIFPTRWRDHLPLAIGIALIHPGILLASTLFSPITRADLADPHAVVWLVVYSMMIALSLTNAVAVSHLTWSLRRESFAEKQVGRYRLLRCIGRGGMGEVWAAMHLGLGREVALKLLEVREGDRAIATDRFEREVRATSELTHPNTVRVYDFGATDDGFLFYAMELLEGEHLGALVTREGALPQARALFLVTQAARALAEAHTLGIVHRDVKSENLFVTNAGGEHDFLKVLDFGVAKLMAGREAAQLTETGVLAGTPVTMSPEVIRGDVVGPPADVYALGAVFYLLLTGRYPFEGEARAKTLLSHLSDPVIPPSVRVKGEIARDLEEVVMKCLEKDPADRYPNADALAVVLDACSVAGQYRPARGTPVRSQRPAPRGSFEPTLAEAARRPRPRSVP